MPTVDPKEPRLKRDWVGRTVRLKREVHSGAQTLAVGAIATVTQYYRGLRLESTPCEHCHVGIHISQVPEHAVELLLDEK